MSACLCVCVDRRCWCLKFFITSVSWMPQRRLRHPTLVVILQLQRSREFLRWCLWSDSGRGLSGSPVPCLAPALATSCWPFWWSSSCRPEGCRCFLPSAHSSHCLQVFALLWILRFSRNARDAKMHDATDSKTQGCYQGQLCIATEDSRKMLLFLYNPNNL